MYEIPSSALPDQLKCGLCDNYLSYFPIVLSSTYQNICGRCNSDQEHDPTNQNIAYETIANFFKFPCLYRTEGCTEDFYPKDIPQHEKTCPFRIVPCPTNFCPWKGSLPMVIEHCQDQHFEMFLKENSGFDIIPSNLSEHNNFIIHDGKLLIIKWKFEKVKHILSYAICHCPYEIDKKNYSCHLNMQRYKKNFSVEFDTSSSENTQFAELLLEIFGNEDSLKLIGLIHLGESVQEKEESSKATTNLDMLSVLKCSKCGEFVLPPIFENDGNVFCRQCLKHRFGSIIELRSNVNLSSIANLLKYPCKFQKSGCCFSAKPDEMKKHYLVCDYTGSICVLVLPNGYTKCSWRGQQKALIPHIEASHDFTASGEESSVPPIQVVDVVLLGIIKFSGNFFRMVFQIADGHYLWTVQPILSLVDKFKYEVEIVDVNKTGDRLVARKTCSTFNTNTIDFSEDKNECHCYFHRDQLKRFFTTEGRIHYKINIFKQM